MKTDGQNFEANIPEVFKQLRKYLNEQESEEIEWNREKLEVEVG